MAWNVSGVLFWGEISDRTFCGLLSEEANKTGKEPPRSVKHLGGRGNEEEQVIQLANRLYR